MDENLNNLNGEGQPSEPQNVGGDAGQGYTVTPQGGYFSFTPPAGSQRIPYEQPTTMPEENFTPPQSTPMYQPTEEPQEPPHKEKKPKKGVSLATVIIASLLAAIIGAGSAVAIIFAFNDNIIGSGNAGSNSAGDPVADGDGNIVNIDVSDVDATVVEAVAEKVTPSVVGIRTTVEVSSFFGSTQESSGEGSGVIYSSDGYIITNYHVISNAVEYSNSKIQVYLSSEADTGYDATVIGYNISCDLAVIKINATNLPAITVAKSDNLKAGQFVVAIGNPGGLEFMGSVTYGVISGLNRIVADSYDSEDVELIQIDAAINPGNSGGALVNIKGELIGINSSKIVAESYEGMGFAIPSDKVMEICKRIIEKKDAPTPYIGITINDRYDSETLQMFGYPAGAVIYSVAEGSPAEKAGLQQNDIITELNGKTITGYNSLLDAISLCDPGDTVSITVYRNGREYKGTVTVSSNNAR